MSVNTPRTISKKALAGLLVMLLGIATISTVGVSSASAQQSIIACPLQPQPGRTIVSFGTTTPIVAHLTIAEAATGPVAVALPDGVYNITAISYDGHSTRQPPQNQTAEQFYLRLNNGQTTNSISDLPENSDSLTEQINANFTITGAVSALFAQHSQYPDPSEPNSITPVCAAFDNITPTPTPTPLVLGNSSPGDEQDCCPGPDPAPEQTPTPSPRVAGVQTTAPTPSPTPRVAGAIANFPTAGPALWATVVFIGFLLAALCIIPAVDRRPH